MTDAAEYFKNKNVLVVGGTGGIGGAIAKQFASRGANVIVAGRNVVAGQNIVDEMRILSKDTANANKFAFEKFDASLISSTKALLMKLQTHYDHNKGLDIMILAIGGLSNGVRKETEEGHEKYLAVDGYARYILVAGLIKQLSKTKGSSVWNIKAGAEGEKFDIDDIELKKTKRAYTTWAVMGRDAGINDVLTAEYNRRYPEIWFNHVYPGIVRTELARRHELGWFSWIILLAGWLFGSTPDGYAEGFVTKSVMSEDREGHYWQPKGKKVEAKEKWTQEEETGKKLVAKMQEVTGIKL